jgi:hypothetical protein
MAAHLTDYSDLPVEEPCPDTLAATLEKATGKDIPTLLQPPPTGPSAPNGTNFSKSPPGQHFTKNPRTGIRPGPSLTAPFQTTNIYDMEATAVGIGSGKPLSAYYFRRWRIQNPMPGNKKGNCSNQADILFRKIDAVVAPNDAPPMPPGR